jgi:hypothetical protein
MYASIDMLFKNVLWMIFEQLKLFDNDQKLLLLKYIRERIIKNKTYNNCLKGT